MEKEQNPENAGIKQEIRNEKGQFIPGVSGNPDGKPKGVRSFTTKVREALAVLAEGRDYSYEEAFVKAILKKAIVDQDPAIMKLIWNYLDGMPLQKNDVTTLGEKLYGWDHYGKGSNL